MMILAVSLLSALISQAAPAAQEELRIFAAPFGPALVKAHPDVRIFFQSQRTTSHVTRLGSIEARATSVTCDAAFTVALGQLVGSAVSAGGNGVVDVRSHEAPDSRAPTFACQRGEGGFAVRLTAVAARLNGSDAPVIAARPGLPGTAYRTFSPTPGLPLPPLYEGGSVRLPVPGVFTRTDEIRLLGQSAGPAVLRRIQDVDAVGVSTLSCPDALQIALTNLYKESQKVEGAGGVVGVRSPGLDVAVGGYTYLCEEKGPNLTVRLTGVAAGAAII